MQTARPPRPSNDPARGPVIDPSTPPSARLGFGAAPASGTYTARETRALLDVAYENGIRHFDTAPVYGWGEGEAAMGAFAANRSDVTIATKVGISPPSRTQRLVAKLSGKEAAARRGQFTPAQVRHSVEQSLRRLGTPRLDALLLHEPGVEDVDDELIGTLEALKHEGKIAAAGVAANADVTAALLMRYPDAFQIAQIPAAGIVQIASAPAKVSIITHSVLGPRVANVLSRLQADQALAANFHDETGLAADDPFGVAQTLLRVALARNSDGITLFSSSREAVVRSNANLSPASESLVAIVEAALTEAPAS